MAYWRVWVKATKNGEQKYHASYHVHADTDSAARRNAVAKAEQEQRSYKDCKFSATTSEKIRD